MPAPNGRFTFGATS